jgi:hypothetical protein
MILFKIVLQFFTFSASNMSPPRRKDRAGHSDTAWIVLLIRVPNGASRQVLCGTPQRDAWTRQPRRARMPRVEWLTGVR